MMVARTRTMLGLRNQYSSNVTGLQKKCSDIEKAHEHDGLRVCQVIKKLTEVFESARFGNDKATMAVVRCSQLPSRVSRTCERSVATGVSQIHHTREVGDAPAENEAMIFAIDASPVFQRRWPCCHHFKDEDHTDRKSGRVVKMNLTHCADVELLETDFTFGRRRPS